MGLFSIEQQRFGLKKEAVRGVAEAAPDKWYPTRGKPDLTYGLELLEDEGIRGSFSSYVPSAGLKVGEGTIPLYGDAQMLGEALLSLMGSVVTTQQGGTPAYEHVFEIGNSIQKPSYTLFLDRGLEVLKYNLAVCQKIDFKSAVDGLMEVDTTWLFKSEASGSIGTPAYPTQQYLGFQHVDFKLTGSSNTNVKDWTLTLNNQAESLRTLSKSQDVTDIVTPLKFQVEGGFTIYFVDVVERDRFLANTTTEINIIAAGNTIPTTGDKYTVQFVIHDIRYKAFPYGEDNGLLAAQVTFTSYFSLGTTKHIEIKLLNEDTSY